MAQGRKPKPQALKLLEGNRGKRAMNTKEPKFEAGIGEPPPVMTPRAKELWFEISAEWRHVGIDKRAFRPLLTQLCQAIADWEAAHAITEQVGAYFIGDNGEPKRHPATKDKQSLTTIIRSLLSESGLTPSAASKIVAPADAEDDPLTAMGI